MPNRINPSFPDKYNLDKDTNLRQISALSKPTPDVVQAHGVISLSQLMNDVISSGARVLNIGTSDGRLWLEQFAQLDAGHVDCIEPSTNAVVLQTNIDELLGNGTSGTVINEMAEEALPKLVKQDVYYDLIVADIALQYCHNKIAVLGNCLELISLTNPNACIRLLFTGPGHGEEYVIAYQTALNELSKEDKKWSQMKPGQEGMLAKPELFEEGIKALGDELGMDLEVETNHNFNSFFREEEPEKPLLRRERVQKGILFKGLDKADTAVLRAKIIEVLGRADNPGETVQVSSVTIRNRAT
jgi:hypothetical protein